MSAALQDKPVAKFKLTVVKGPHVGAIFQFSQSVITFGRGPENSVVLMNDPQISRSHAQLSVVNGEVEVTNLSQKNAVVVSGASVQRWKIVNNSSFIIGDSEINVEYDLGHAVVTVSADKMADVVPIKPAAKPLTSKNVAVPPKRSSSSSKSKNSVPATRSQAPAPRGSQQQGMMPSNMRQQSMMQMNPMQQQVGFPQSQTGMPYDPNAAYQGMSQAQQAEQDKNDSLMANPNFKIFLIFLIAIGFGYSYVSTPNKKTTAKKIASTLKYEDEVNNRLVSKKEKDLEEDREYMRRQKQSPQSLRVNENFIRGMRDFQLGNYVRSQEFFQLVLNLEPDHALAKRHHYLAKVRFDEIVQEKLMLGESYYKKHNFRMCQAMYTQVMNMLEGKNSEQKFLLAEKRAKECELASQGIR